MENIKENSKNTTEYLSGDEQMQIKVELLEQEVEVLKAKVNWYEEQYRLSQQRRFGSSSEHTQVPEQISVFNEAEVEAKPELPEETYEVIVNRRRKQKGDRDSKLDNLPVERVEYQISEEEQICQCCGGQIHEMDKDIRRELKVIPAQVVVVEHVQSVYACRTCEKEGTSTPIIKAPMPQPAIPFSLASSTAIAYVMSQKYVECMPLYRMQQNFARMGIDLSRQTMANWIIQGAERWLTYIYDRMHEIILLKDILHCDETTLQVLHELERQATSTSYMWLYRTGRYDVPIVLYEYQTTRASKHPARFLEGFSGYIHADGYAGYNGLRNTEIVGCFAHARRKFDEALKALPSEQRAKPTASKEGLDFCNKLFEIERDINDLCIEERYQIRLKRSRPVMDAFLAWLKYQTPRTLPKSALGQAIQYCRNQWDKLECFLKDGRLEISNNRAERSIKPFVLSRKNFLFSNTPKGAKASAMVFSIVETAKENGLNPFAYLTYLFDKLPNINVKEQSELDKLLPWSESLPDICKSQIKTN